MIIKLRVVQGRPAGKSLSFPHGEYYFGRGSECHVRPNSDWVSRQHCLLRVTSDAVTLRDLGSRNGTLVNGTLLEHERILRHGDQVQIGPLVFEVQLDTPADVNRTSASVPAGLADTQHPTASPPSLESTEHLPVLPPRKAE